MSASQNLGEPIRREADFEAVVAQSSEGLELAHVNSVLSSHAMWKAIETMNDEIDGSSGGNFSSDEQLVVRVASTTGVGLVAALTAYLLRGGALLASLISASPLWTVYDPLPVLRDTKEDKRVRFRKKPVDQTDSDAPRTERIEKLFGDRT